MLCSYVFHASSNRAVAILLGLRAEPPQITTENEGFYATDVRPSCVPAFTHCAELLYPRGGPARYERTHGIADSPEDGRDAELRRSGQGGRPGHRSAAWRGRFVA